MPDYSPEHWRDRAELVRAMAADAGNPEMRDNLLEIARSYERLARMAEQRRKRDVDPDMI